MNKRVIIITVIILIIFVAMFLGIVELLYEEAYGIDSMCLVPCKNIEACATEWEECNHNILEKIQIIIKYYTN